MKPKQILKLWVDAAMTAALLLLMAYELVGSAAHEWLGIAMLALFLLHHALNGKWSRSLLKGRYTALRIWQTALAGGIFLCMAGSMVSGIVLSRHALAFLQIRRGQGWARTLHMLSSYWGFLLMSLHLGLHWGSLLHSFHHPSAPASRKRVWLLRAAAAGVAAYGIYAFLRRDIGSYLLLKTEFVFFDFQEPLLLFFLDYLAVMGAFVFAGHYLTAFFRWCSRKRRAVPSPE